MNITNDFYWISIDVVENIYVDIFRGYMQNPLF